MFNSIVSASIMQPLNDFHLDTKYEDSDTAYETETAMMC